MDYCSIFEFRNGVSMPYKMLTTLKNIEPHIETLTRSKYFAECRITDNGADALLYAPIHQESLHMVHRANIALMMAYKHGFVRMEILNEEMQHLNTPTMQLGDNRRCTLIKEQLPEGELLETAIHRLSRETLLQGLERLDVELRSYDISHNNLSINNIIVDSSNRWLPIRQYYTERGYGGDSSAIEVLRELILKHTTPTTKVDLSATEPWCDMPQTTDGLHDGRRRCVTEHGVGFKDEYGRMVIKDRYLAVGDFMEGRAIVLSKANKMGLIDRSGREIIEAIYDRVQYSTDSGRSIVVCKDKCAIFDYNGRQISKWVDYEESL